jgi:DNA-binding response OmpR family regulator
VVHSTLADPDTAICALASGADDFVTKSDSFAVLDARIHAILRRFAPVRSSPSILSYGSYSLSLDKSELTINSEVIDLTPREFDLAWMFFSSPSRLLRKYDIIAAIWGKETTAGEHTLAQHIYSLRRKCGFERHGFRLTAVYGIGYRLDNMPTDRDESLLTRSPLTATDR